MDTKYYRPFLTSFLMVVVGFVLTGLYVFTVKAGARSPQSWIWHVDDPPGPQTALIAEQPGGGFASAITTGDVNGDSFPDLLIGAPYVEHGLRGEGEVYILPGPLPFGQTIPMPQRTALRLFGRKPESYLGALLDTGDLNGDSFADIIAGAYHDGENFVILGSQGIYHYSPLEQNAYPGLRCDDCGRPERWIHYLQSES